MIYFMMVKYKYITFDFLYCFLLGKTNDKERIFSVNKEKNELFKKFHFYVNNEKLIPAFNGIHYDDTYGVQYR